MCTRKISSDAPGVESRPRESLEERRERLRQVHARERVVERPLDLRGERGGRDGRDLGRGPPHAAALDQTPQSVDLLADPDARLLLKNQQGQELRVDGVRPFHVARARRARSPVD